MIGAPIPDHDFVSNLLGTTIMMRLGLNFNWAGTNSVMTHVLVLSANMRRNEWLK